MTILTVVGNPRAGSRTYGVAVGATDALVTALGDAGARDLGSREVVDLAALAPALLSPTPSSGVEVALELAATADVLVLASPTYKGTYTGLLKAFLDRLPSGALSGAAALPLLVMGDPRHALAVEVHFRPLLVELGAFVPTPGLAVLESQLGDLDGVLGAWADRVAPQVGVALREGVRA
ncbi:FMN reductase [Microtetraspora sp. NBRC 13810]|uniref:NADPH-dependent FMN reductase n=1 Tax=Microtetraspora sp. NBRC 13810 TaxID=3030990 RepID=UPI0024A25009|nr:NADPH-dependent FMN reductase [Microtetraspora sp. NBRC 13810]GLW06258.1 FMN reductase [Microtetraspora sp. NBRC 13810]